MPVIGGSTVKHQIHQTANVVRRFGRAGCRVDLLPALTVGSISKLNFFVLGAFDIRDGDRIVVTGPENVLTRTRPRELISVGVIAKRGVRDSVECTGNRHGSVRTGLA